eukprot:TRINITY_DN29438_c0_g1_i1.p1 TRINITY_DN29438_c0_g1~~TRINITY_DN29438_c0_g1_i1.p1  ORF type:complete len:411 (-),score=94.68 TRINITY_DN29438_c0_g1_i1:19-1251(-)
MVVRRGVQILLRRGAPRWKAPDGRRGECLVRWRSGAASPPPLATATAALATASRRREFGTATAAAFAAGVAEDVAGAGTTDDVVASPAELELLLEELQRGPVDEGLQRLQAAETALTAALAGSRGPERLALLRRVADLGALPGRPFPVAKFFVAFLEDYGAELGTLRDGETMSERAAELREVLRCFHVAGVNTGRLRLIYSNIEEEFPRIEAAGALLPMQAAVNLLHLMLSTDLSSPGATIVLLRSALREPLMHVADDSRELRLLKMIEMLLRVDFLATQEQLPRDVSEYLSVVRSLRYYDRELRRDTPLSYQMAYFLRKHNFPAKRHMLGPYALKICDPVERINFEPVEERSFGAWLREEPPARKRRHLEALGWRHIEVKGADWAALETYEAKADHIRNLLKEQSLLDP